MDAFLGQIAIAAFGVVPKNWALCNGQILPIAQNQALFSLLSNTFGGDGKTTFALPDLRGRTPVGVGPDPSGGTATTLAGAAGSEGFALGVAQIPGHMHGLQVTTSNQGTLTTPSGNSVGTGIGGNQPYASSTDGSTMNTAALSQAGAGQPHENRQPFQVVNFIIALTGYYPVRS